MKSTLILFFTYRALVRYHKTTKDLRAVVNFESSLATDYSPPQKKLGNEPLPPNTWLVGVTSTIERLCRRVGTSSTCTSRFCYGEHRQAYNYDSKNINRYYLESSTQCKQLENYLKKNVIDGLSYGTHCTELVNCSKCPVLSLINDGLILIDNDTSTNDNDMCIKLSIPDNCVISDQITSSNFYFNYFYTIKIDSILDKCSPH